MIRRILTALATVCLAWSWCLAVQGSVAAAPSLPTSAYTYSSHAHPTVSAMRTFERGPPALAYDHTALLSSVVHGSRGALARPHAGSGWTDTTYDHTGRYAQPDGGRATSGTVPEARRGDLRSVSGASVAANEGDGLLASRLRAMQSERGAAGLPGRGDLSFARKVKLAPDNPAVINRGMPVQDFVSQFRNAKILREPPDEFLDMTVEDALRAGNSTVRKLLTDGRWSR